jgi:hypothetical protein
MFLSRSLTWICGAGVSARDVDRGMNPDIGLAPAVVDRPAEMGDGIVIGQVDRGQRCMPARGLDTVVELLQPTDGAPHGDHMGAPGRQPFGRGRAKAARGAGDKRHLIFERSHLRLRHGRADMPRAARNGKGQAAGARHPRRLTPAGQGGIPWREQMHKPTTGGFIMSRDTTLAQAAFGDLTLPGRRGWSLPAPS